MANGAWDDWTKVEKVIMPRIEKLERDSAHQTDVLAALSGLPHQVSEIKSKLDRQERDEREDDRSMLSRKTMLIIAAITVPPPIIIGILNLVLNSP